MGLQLKWSRAELLEARDQYLADTSQMARERRAFEAGARMRTGKVDLGDFYAIVDWKSSRPKSLIERGNDPEDILDALRIAVTTSRERSAVAILCGLYGVNVRMASAVSTAIHPERYTVIDVRALDALGVRKAWSTVDDYLEYLRFCQDHATRIDLSLRDFDRALWVLGRP